MLNAIFSCLPLYQLGTLAAVSKKWSEVVNALFEQLQFPLSFDKLLALAPPLPSPASAHRIEGYLQPVRRPTPRETRLFKFMQWLYALPIKHVREAILSYVSTGDYEVGAESVEFDHTTAIEQEGERPWNWLRDEKENENTLGRMLWASIHKRDPEEVALYLTQVGLQQATIAAIIARASKEWNESHVATLMAGLLQNW